MGDYLSQSRDDGGLALGTVGTSVIFLLAISGAVISLTRTKVDQAEVQLDASTGGPPEAAPHHHPHGSRPFEPGIEVE